MFRAERLNLSNQANWRKSHWKDTRWTMKNSRNESNSLNKNCCSDRNWSKTTTIILTHWIWTEHQREGRDDSWFTGQDCRIHCKTVCDGRGNRKSHEVTESVEAPRTTDENEEIEGLKRQIEELTLQREAVHHVYDTEDLQSQLEDAQTTVNAFKVEINRLKGTSRQISINKHRILEDRLFKILTKTRM